MSDVDDIGTVFHAPRDGEESDPELTSVPGLPDEFVYTATFRVDAKLLESTNTLAALVVPDADAANVNASACPEESESASGSTD